MKVWVDGNEWEWDEQVFESSPYKRLTLKLEREGKAILLYPVEPWTRMGVLHVGYDFSYRKNVTEEMILDFIYDDLVQFLKQGSSTKCITKIVVPKKLISFDNGSE